MTQIVVQTMQSFTRTTNTPTSVVTSTTGVISKMRVTQRLDMYPGIKKKVRFSGDQETGEETARQYMQAMTDFHTLRRELERMGEGARDPNQYRELEEIKLAVVQF